MLYALLCHLLKLSEISLVFLISLWSYNYLCLLFYHRYRIGWLQYLLILLDTLLPASLQVILHLLIIIRLQLHLCVVAESPSPCDLPEIRHLTPNLTL